MHKLSNVDIYFGDNTPLGMSLSSDLHVSAFSPNSIAQTHGVLKSDRLIRVNDEDVKDLTVQDVANKVKNAVIPKKLTFESMVSLHSRPYYVSSAQEAEDLIIQSNIELDKKSKLNFAEDEEPPEKHGEFRVLGGEGQSFTFQFARAEFGPYTNCDAVEIVFSDPLNGCGNVVNSESMDNKFVVVERGMCTFVEKVAMIQVTGAIGVIVVNAGQRGVIEMPSGGMSLSSKIVIPSIMIPQDSLVVIQSLIPSGIILGQIAANNHCDGKKSLYKLQEMYEEIQNKDNSTNIEKVNTVAKKSKKSFAGGILHFAFSKNEIKFFDFLQSEFGGNIVEAENKEKHKEIELVISSPYDACSAILNPHQEIRGKAVMVERGTCSMADKIRRIQTAGGMMGVIINSEVGLIHIPAQFGEDRGIKIPSLMISKTAGTEIRRAIGSKNSIAIKLSLDNKISETWRELNNLLDPSNWPEDEKKRLKSYRRQSLLYHPDKPTGSIDRFELMHHAYYKANYHYDIDLQKSIDFDQYVGN